MRDAVAAAVGTRDHGAGIAPLVIALIVAARVAPRGHEARPSAATAGLANH
jgi:hypothetical protein